ncbi:MAG: hypothetical protein N4A33_06310 [Bacteriovoracaceae bacterium]|jgi:hypothetical protein|nr:hypothetical protein [Bacteriovoracaceae bacterium]
MSNVIDFQARRKNTIEKRKRSFERVLFREFLGSYAEIDSHGNKYSVNMVDISHDGCLLQVPFSKSVQNHFKDVEAVTVRVYFTKEEFLPVVVNIKHGTEYIDEKGDAYIRFGGTFDKSIPSFSAFKPFIDFIYKFAEFSCIEKGESEVYFL